MDSTTPMTTGRGGRFRTPDKPTAEERRQAREVSLGRIARLFTPYRWSVLVVVAIIVASSIVGLASPFLLRGIIDTALPQQDLRLLVLLTVGDGRRRRRDLRARRDPDVDQHEGRPARHARSPDRRLRPPPATVGRASSPAPAPARCSRGSPTTSAACSRSSRRPRRRSPSNLTTTVATAVAMVALSWRLALISLVVLPPAIWLSRRVARMRREITALQQRELADLNVTIDEGLSINGVQLSKTMGTGPTLVRRFTESSARLIDLELRSQLAGRWRMASMSVIFAAIPAVIYLSAGLPMTAGTMTIGTLIAFTALQSQLFRPLMGLLNTGVQVVSSLALFQRVFEYLDLPVEVDEPVDPVDVDPATIRGQDPLRGRRLHLPGERRARPRRRRPRRSGRHHDGAGRRDRVGQDDSCVAGRPALRPHRGTGHDRRRRPAPPAARRSRRDRGRGQPGDLPAAHQRAREPPLRATGRHRRRDRGGGAGRPHPRPPRSRCPRATTPWSVRAVTASPAGRSSASPSPGPCSGTHGSSCSTRRPARSTPRPSARCSRRSTPCRRVGRRSPSPTGSRPSATPTRSWSSTTVASSSAGTHATLVADDGRYAALAA